MRVEIQARPWYTGDAVEPKTKRRHEITLENPWEIIHVVHFFVVFSNKKLHNYLELQITHKHKWDFKINQVAGNEQEKCTMKNMSTKTSK